MKGGVEMAAKKKPIKKDKPVKKGHEWQEMKKAPVVTKKPAKKKK